MTQYNPHKHHRRSIRLPGWDYRTPGYYFVTISTYQRQNLFSDQAFYEIAADALERIPQQRHAAHVVLDEWVVMPNHAHLILVFITVPAGTDMTAPSGNFTHALAGSLGVFVGRYKTAVTTRINNLRHSKGTAVWQAWLLRTHHPQRTGTERHPPIHHQQPRPLG